MQTRLSRWVVIGITIAVALKLFALGLSYPLGMRVKGDAYIYLTIASSFESLWSAFSYTGERTAGLPIFEYAIRTIARPDQLLPWVDAICLALLLIHLATAWLFSRWMGRLRIIRSLTGSHLLFAFLATYPALVGHTTAPLTDTLAIDLILWGFMLVSTAFDTPRVGKSLAFAATAGLALGFAILVRSGSLPAVVLALLCGVAFSLSRGRRMLAVLGIVAAATTLMVAPSAIGCSQKTGSICLQPPGFDSAGSAQAGLRGARTVWNYGGRVDGDIPTLPDGFMVDTYSAHCQLTSLVGTGSTSLTGCLVSRPAALPIYLAKKWIGLFDHFRFTPYLETTTPAWLRWLSRGYASLAWIGFALSFAALFQALRRGHRAALKEIIQANPAAAMLAVYSAVMLGLHTTFHIEDRYSFPLLPLCAAVLVAYAERAVTAWRAGQGRRIAPLAAYCAVAVMIFLAQIILWDNTAFY